MRTSERAAIEGTGIKVSDEGSPPSEGVCVSTCDISRASVALEESLLLNLFCETLMKSSSAILFASMCTAGGLASAQDIQFTTPPTEVHGVRLAALCSLCGVVTDTRVETRKGNASGVGAVGGAVLGGVVGHEIGGGKGKTAMTVLGALGGVVAGNAIEKNVKKTTVWLTTVTLKDGSTQSFERAADPGVQRGDVVKVENGQLVKQRS